MKIAMYDGFDGGCGCSGAGRVSSTNMRYYNGFGLPIVAAEGNDLPIVQPGTNLPVEGPSGRVLESPPSWLWWVVGAAAVGGVVYMKNKKRKSRRKGRR